MRRLPLLLTASLLAFSCASDKNDGETGTVSDGTDGTEGTDGTGSDGTTGPASPTLQLEAVPATLWLLPNVDDDDEDRQRDLGLHLDEEVVSLGLPDTATDDLGDGTLRVTLPDTDLGVWSGAEHRGQGGEIVLSAADDPASLAVEAADFSYTGEVLIEVLDLDGSVLDSATVTVHTPPLILNHHLQEATSAMAVRISAAGWGTNADMVADFEAVLGSSWLAPNASLYDFDVWVQDELEFASASLPDRNMTVVLDSIRSRGGNYLDAFPEDNLLGPDVAVQTWGTGGATSQDSFGNLEVTPPVTLDGVEYPFGRIYWGDGGSAMLRPTTGLTNFLEDQRVQSPFTLDISWLCVGHVDEFTSFLPDPTAPRGFRLYVADIHEGYGLLESLDGAFAIPRYADHGVETVAELLEDESLRAYNEDLQLDGIDPAVEVLIAELQLTEDEIVRVPSLFERASGCGGTAVALIPGTINMAVYTNADGTGAELFLPDPFFRSDLDDPSTDPVIAAIEPLLPAATTKHWVDGWDIYHLGWGEVHCGTNVNRSQTVDWWTAASHLVEETP